MFYKETNLQKTPIGKIPKDWEVVKLGNTKLFELVMGQSPPSSAYNRESEGLPFLQGNAEFGAIYPNPTVYCSRPLKIAKSGDVLISVRAPVGEVNIANTECCIGRGVGAIRAKEDVNNHFIFYCLKSMHTKLDSISGGSTFKAVTKNQLENFKIPFLPLSEQQAISDILSSVDNALDETREIIAKTERLKQGLMQELLTKGMGHKEFKDTEIGRIPKDWEVVQIGKVAKFQGGYAFKSQDYSEGGVKLFKISNVSFGKVTWDDVSYLPQSYLKEYSDYALKPNDLLMAMTRPITSGGIKIARIPERDCPCLLNQRVGRFILKEGIDGGFLFQILFDKKFVNAIGLGALGSQQPNISATQIEEIRVPLPHILEQQKIAEILSGIDEKLEIERTEKERLERVKRGLMEVLLTGRIRVRVS